MRFCFGRIRPTRRDFGALLGLSLAAGLLLGAPQARGNSDPFAGVEEKGTGIGAMYRWERSPYKGAGARPDFMPLYLYEGEHLYLHSNSVGLKVPVGSSGLRFDAFLQRRFESSPYDPVPESLAGMAIREPGIDAGLRVRMPLGEGSVHAEVLHDVTHLSHGSELRVGYRYAWRRGNLWLRPYAMVGFRDAKLNDYYYGVRPEEATPDRPAYAAGAGVMPEIGIWGAYSLTERFRLIGGFTLARWPQSVISSPIVDSGLQWQVAGGVMYDLSPSPEKQIWAEARPLILRAYYGDSTDCNVLQVAEATCTTTHTADHTSVAAVEIGQMLLPRLYNWPLDIAVFAGLQRHFEAGFQPDFWSVRAYVKPYFYGFPWDAKVRTRIGLGLGLSYAESIPLMEQRDLAARGRNSSKLLQTFDPTIDVNVGDIVNEKKLRSTYVGLGVSHRSGIFGSSQLYGNVDGGSNYIYVYLETGL
ncbi:MAG TPA: MipA/OmpV family protein [Burkholderiales bacterium]